MIKVHISDLQQMVFTLLITAREDGSWGTGLRAPRRRGRGARWGRVRIMSLSTTNFCKILHNDVCLGVWGEGGQTQLLRGRCLHLLQSILQAVVSSHFCQKKLHFSSSKLFLKLLILYIKIQIYNTSLVILFLTLSQVCTKAELLPAALPQELPRHRDQ